MVSFYENEIWNPTIFNIICLVTGLMGRTTHWPSVWCSKHFFFIISYRFRALKTLYFYFCKKNKRINWNNFCKEFCKKLWKKNNTWNIRRLVNESFVPVTQRIILKIVGFLFILNFHNAYLSIVTKWIEIFFAGAFFLKYYVEKNERWFYSFKSH